MVPFLDHEFKPGRFSPMKCQVMLARYPCPYPPEAHPKLEPDTIRLTITVEWKPDPKSYSPDLSVEDMAKIEKDAVLEDPSLLVWLAEHGKFTVEGEATNES